jgi:hypothetical protein
MPWFADHDIVAARGPACKPPSERKHGSAIHNPRGRKEPSKTPTDGPGNGFRERSIPVAQRLRSNRNLQSSERNTAQMPRLQTTRRSLPPETRAQIRRTGQPLKARRSRFSVNAKRIELLPNATLLHFFAHKAIVVCSVVDALQQWLEPLQVAHVRSKYLDNELAQNSLRKIARI